MSRRKIKPKVRVQPLPGYLYNFLVSGTKPEGDQEGASEIFMLGGRNNELSEIWKEHGPDITERFAAENPGHRPYAWWHFDAPSPRRKISGIPTEEKYPSVLPYYKMGMSVYHSEEIAADPPVYESQAAYLGRHGLFFAGEENALK